MTPFDYSVNLRVKHPSRHPDAIATDLAMSPRTAWNVGEPRVSASGRLLGGTRTETYCWFPMGDGHDGELARCLSDALLELETRVNAVRALKATGGTIQFYVFWYPNGDTGQVFDTALLSRMAALGIDLGINVYDDRNAPEAN